MKFLSIGIQQLTLPTKLRVLLYLTVSTWSADIEFNPLHIPLIPTTVTGVFEGFCYVFVK